MLFFFLASSIPIVITTALWYRALSQPSEIDWELILFSTAVHVLLCLILAIVSFTGLAAIIGFLIAIAASFAALIAALTLAIFLEGKRKIAAGVMAVVFPVTLFLSSTAGIGNTPEIRNRKAVVEALAEYHADNGTYPEWLHELVPQHLTNLPEQLSVWGWLYFPNADTDEYTLAYVSYIDKWAGYSFDFYRSSVGEWEYSVFTEVGPEFRLPETPMSNRPIPSPMPTIFAYQSQIAPTISVLQTRWALTPIASPQPTLSS